MTRLVPDVSNMVYCLKKRLSEKGVLHYRIEEYITMKLVRLVGTPMQIEDFAVQLNNLTEITREEIDKYYNI